MSTDIDACRLESEKRWSKMQIEIQKLRDSQEVFDTKLAEQAKVISDIQDLSSSVAVLASNMDGMLKELQLQNNRLTCLEQKPVKRWNSILDTIVKLVVTAAIGAILVKIGLA